MNQSFAVVTEFNNQVYIEGTSCSVAVRSYYVLTQHSEEKDLSAVALGYWKSEANYG